MSTVPEVIVANHLDLRVAAVSVLTDECDPDNLEPVNIEEINLLILTNLFISQRHEHAAH